MKHALQTTHVQTRLQMLIKDRGAQPVSWPLGGSQREVLRSLVIHDEDQSDQHNQKGEDAIFWCTLTNAN